MQKIASPTQRILSLWLPRLPTDRIARQRWGKSWRCEAPGNSLPTQAQPFAMAGRVKNGQFLTAIDKLAQKRGLRCGEAVSDARSRVPELEIFPADAKADQNLLAGIADWCDRYSSHVSLDGTDGLLLDVSGRTHHFDGEAALVADSVVRLKQQGFAARAAVADAAGDARAKARRGSTGDNANQEHLPVADIGPERPVRLLAQPEPVETVATMPEGPPLLFRWRKALHEVVRADGPERVTARPPHRGVDRPTRDYYRVEDDSGLRFWLFREGHYGKDVENPRWCMHGVFS